MSEFCFHLISWEQIDVFWWTFVYAVLWLAHEIFLNFSTELWPLIGVKISIFRNNEKILTKFCLCIDIWSVLWLIHIIFPNFSTELWPLIDFKICLCSISCEIIGGFDQIWYFYAKTCATTKISTVAGYHLVLSTLLYLEYHETADLCFRCWLFCYPLVMEARLCSLKREIWERGYHKTWFLW